MSKSVLVVAMKALLLIAFTLCSLPTLAVQSPKSPAVVEVVRVMDNNNIQANSMDYFKSLLDKALEQSLTKYGPYELQRVNAIYTQERLLRLLGKGIMVDVMHTMTSAQREQNYLPVPVPLLGGLLGNRMLLVRADHKEEFEAIRNSKVLRNKVACQGMTWPDSDILEANGFVVARVKNFESMFEMLEKGRCDYIPRGINEVFDELQTYHNKFGAIALVDNILLNYPAPVYFFVSNNKPQLAERIHYGLRRMHQQQKLYPFLKQHPMVSAVFPLQQWDKLRVCHLQNKGIAEVPKQTFPWFQVGKQSLNCNQDS